MIAGRLVRVLLIACVLIVAACKDEGPRDYREAMRALVAAIGSYARSYDAHFILIPQNGQELITSRGEAGDTLAANYLQAIDGLGREDLFYGYHRDDERTPPGEQGYITAFLDRALACGKTILVTDYCYTSAKIDSSYYYNAARNYISFAASRRELDQIPRYPAVPYQSNTDAVTRLPDVKNFLYLINPSGFASKASYLAALDSTNYDLLIVDLFFNDSALTVSDVQALKTKPGGASRLVVAYMSIGEAENYRYYWKPSWNTHPPSWLAAANPDWPGNYKVRYWDSDWQAILYGNDASYTKKILDAGFDGVYLDIIDAFEYFEQ